jgi:hypothetical protein
MTSPKRYRTVDSVGKLISDHLSLLSAAEQWSGLPSGVAVEELVLDVWEEVPTCELAHALKAARERTMRD